MTYYAHGDTRKRGMALLRVQARPTAAPATCSNSSSDELPDHLCVVLEFAATVDPAARPGAAARPPGRARAAPARPAGRGYRRTSTRCDAVTRDAAAAAPATSGTPYDGSPPQGRPRRRSAWRRSPPPEYMAADPGARR
ncbi:MAG: hypothetical protein WKF47_16440 [Geodermatophilaceae bacterium]